MAQRGRPAGVSGGQAPALSSSQMKACMRVAMSDPKFGLRNHAFLQVLASGCRVSEPTFITAGDVMDGQGGVVASFTLGNAQTKTSKPRRVYLTKDAQKAIAAYLASANFDANERLFPFTPNYATTMVKKILRDAALPNFSSHSFRRSVAHALDDAQVRVQTIALVLGHTSIKTTSAYLENSTLNAERALANLKF